MEQRRDPVHRAGSRQVHRQGVSLLSTTQTNPTPSYTTVIPFAAWNCVPPSTRRTTIVVTKATVSMSRKQDIINGLTGLQSPAQIFEGPLQVTWKISGLADAADTALLYLNNTQPSVDLTMTSSTNAILEIHSTSVAMTAGPFKADKDVIEIDLAGTAWPTPPTIRSATARSRSRSTNLRQRPSTSEARGEVHAKGHTGHRGTRGRRSAMPRN